MKYFFLITLSAVLFLSSCVTRKEYEELEEVKDYYETEAQTADSIRNEYNKLSEEARQLEIEIRNTRLELEEYVVTNKSLNRSYQSVLDRMELIRMERDELDETTAYEKYNLQQQLSEQQYTLDDSQERLNTMERDLYQKENRLSAVEYDNVTMKGTLQQKNIRIAELEQMLNLKEDDMQNIKVTLDDVVARFSSTDLSVEEKGGKLYVSLSSNLLFPSGSTQVNSKGKDALSQLAQALKKNPDIDIMVEGHTDSEGNALTNWKLSVDRAVSVTNVLTTYGVNPERIIASGRGEYVPKASNNTAAGRALNRRTEIVLSPKLDEIYEFLSRD
jgi:chemotaxis protein MotB